MFGLAVGGGLIAVRASGNPFAYVTAAVMLGAAWPMRPRTGHAPTDESAP
jgi:hypothetical protein